jgi:hypothetical protein
MSFDDIAGSVPLLAQLGHEVTADELARRVGDVVVTPDHLVLVAEIEGRLAGLMHVFYGRRSKIHAKRWCRRSSIKCTEAPVSGTL